MSFVVFLDVDGVLNSRETCERTPSELYRGVDEARVIILARSMKECGAKGVVLTSTWKDLEPDDEDYIYLKNKLGDQGIEILGKTEEGRYSQRGTGILEYLERFPKIDEFVILDDNSFDYRQETKLWENYINTQGMGIEHPMTDSKTPTVTAMDFRDVIRKHSK